jgi:hypothetical protein
MTTKEIKTQLENLYTAINANADNGYEFLNIELNKETSQLFNRLQVIKANRKNKVNA